ADSTANYEPLLETIRGTVNTLADSTANYGPLLETIREMADTLWQGQISTNHSLDWLREHHVLCDTELNDRMRRIEDLLQSIIDQPPPAPQAPIYIPAPVERAGSDSDSEVSVWSSIFRRPEPIPEAPMRMPISVPTPQRSFRQQLDDFLSSAGTGVLREAAERPPAIVPFTYDVEGRGIRTRRSVRSPASPPPPRFLEIFLEEVPPLAQNLRNQIRSD
ncbi:hypothetical protein DFH09DRAFT_1439350, partial [Mycena vulgaris]